MPNNAGEEAHENAALWSKIHLTRKLTWHESQALQTLIRGCLWCVKEEQQQPGRGAGYDNDETTTVLDGIVEYSLAMVNHAKTVQHVYDAMLVDLELLLDDDDNRNNGPASPINSLAHKMARVIASFLDEIKSTPNNSSHYNMTTMAAVTTPAAVAVVAAAEVGVEVTTSGSMVPATPTFDSSKDMTTPAVAAMPAVGSSSSSSSGSSRGTSTRNGRSGSSSDTSIIIMSDNSNEAAEEEANALVPCAAPLDATTRPADAAGGHENKNEYQQQLQHQSSDADADHEEKKCEMEDEIHDHPNINNNIIYNNNNNNNNMILLEQKTASYANITMLLENGDSAFQRGNYNLAREEYKAAISNLEMILMMATHYGVNNNNGGDGNKNVPEEQQQHGAEEEGPPTDGVTTPPSRANNNDETLLAVAMTKLNECRIVGKDWKRASIHARIALEYDASNQDAWYQLAKSLYHQKRLRPALEAAKKMQQEDGDRGQRLMLAMKEYFFRVVEKNRDLFRRIIDSYRLWAHDDHEYYIMAAQGDRSNKAWMHSLYGLKAQQHQDNGNCCGDDDDDDDDEEGPLVPVKHFRAYLRMGQGVLPESLMPEKNKISYQALMAMATADDWANIGVITTPMEIEEHYRGIIHVNNSVDIESVESLRAFAVSIAGPIHGDGHKDIMDYISDDDDDA